MKNLFHFQKILISAAGLLSLTSIISCGDKKIEVNPGETPTSEINLNAPEEQDIDSEEAKTFFIDNLWPIMKENNEKGCASSGCHALDESKPLTFFRVDVADAENSWNWAKVRRFERIASDYADLSSSALLSSRATSNHFNFQNWTESDKELITEWTVIP